MLKERFVNICLNVSFHEKLRHINIVYLKYAKPMNVSSITVSMKITY